MQLWRYSSYISLLALSFAINDMNTTLYAINDNYYQRVWYAYLLAQLLSKNELHRSSTFWVVHANGHTSFLGAVGIN